MRPCRNLIWRKILRRQKGYSFYRAAETLKGPKHRCFWAKGAPVVEVQESAWFRSKGSWARVKFALLSIRKITVYFRRATATASPLMRRRSSRCSLLSGVNLALAAGSSDRITISPRPHVQRWVKRSETAVLHPFPRLVPFHSRKIPILVRMPDQLRRTDGHLAARRPQPRLASRVFLLPHVRRATRRFTVLLPQRAHLLWTTPRWDDQAALRCLRWGKHANSCKNRP